MALLTKGLRTALFFLLVGILGIIYFFWRWAIFVREGSGSIDFHIHDTYFVIASFHVAIAVLLVLTLFFSLGGMIGSRFKNWFYLILFFCCSLIIGSIIWVVTNDLKSAGF